MDRMPTGDRFERAEGVDGRGNDQAGSQPPFEHAGRGFRHRRGRLSGRDAHVGSSDRTRECLARQIGGVGGTNTGPDDDREVVA
jgi:hypothetical protein